MDDEPTATIQHADQVVERAANVDVADVDVPVLVRCQRLLEPPAFYGFLAVPACKQPACLSARYTVAGLAATRSASMSM